MNSTITKPKALELLEEAFKTEYFFNSSGQQVMYLHPDWIPKSYFNLLRPHFRTLGEDYRRVANYGERFLGQFIMGNYQNRLIEKTWEFSRKLLKEQQKLHGITDDKVDRYKAYRSLFQKQLVSDVIDPMYLDFAIAHLNPEINPKGLTLASPHYRNLFQKDFSNDNYKQHCQLMLQKYHLKVFLNFIAFTDLP